MNGKWVSLGKFGSPESKAEFERILAELRSGVPATEVAASPDALTVDQLLLLFLEHATALSPGRRHSDRPGHRVQERGAAAPPVARPHPRGAVRTEGSQGGPRAYIDANNCRTLVNTRVGKGPRIFAWAVAEELIPPSVIVALASSA